jgi:hypothetical protein
MSNQPVSLADAPANLRLSAVLIRSLAEMNRCYATNDIVMGWAAPHGVTPDSLNREIDRWEEQANHLDALASSLEQLQPADANICSQEGTDLQRALGVVLTTDREKLYNGMESTVNPKWQEAVEGLLALLVAALQQPQSK